MAIIAFSSITISSTWSTTVDNLGVTNSWLTSSNSLINKASRTSLFDTMASNCLISSFKILYSLFSSLTSVLVKRYKRMTTIASACSCVNWKRSIKLTLASCLSFDFRMMAMISSITETALIKPSKIWARFCLAFRS